MTSPGEPVATLLSTETELIDMVQDVALAAGVAVTVSSSGAAVTDHLSSLLLVGPDVTDLEPVRGGAERVVVVCLGDGPDSAPQVAWRTAARWEADHVAVLPAGRGWLLATLAASGSDRAADGTALAVIPGQGGAGASVLAAAVALAAAGRELRCLLLDADPAGGGVDLLVDAAQQPGARWREVASLLPHLRPGDLASVLPERHGLAVLSHDRGRATHLGAEEERAVLECARADFDLVVVDCPTTHRHPLWAAPADVAVLVTRSEVRAAAAASDPAARLRDRDVPRELVVRTAGRLGMRPRDVGDVVGIPLTAHLRSERDVALAVERGRLTDRLHTGSLARVVDTLLDRMPSAALAA